MTTPVTKHLKQQKDYQYLVYLQFHFQQNIVFNNLPSFINSEISQATNIKNRVNRQSVERALKMFKSRIKITVDVPYNGIIYCFGIDEFNNEIFEEIIPPGPVDKFYYSCDRTFHLDQYDKMFEKKSLGYVIFIDGKECIIYKYDGIWTRVKYFDALLIKRQRKGGQSSVRFSRLAEESRLHYITHIVDILNELITDNQSINYIFGGEELKEMLLTCSNLKPKLKTESAYHSFNRDTINEPYFLTLMNKCNNDDLHDITKKIVEHIEIEPEYLLFSMDEIMKQLKNIEYILTIDDKYINPYKLEIEGYTNKIYHLMTNSPSYEKLHNFQIIGKLYYKSNNQCELLDIDVHLIE